ncbi:MAG: outer membrane beta-barrel family protein, partial [Melioribacteraceae bacterium]
SNLNHSQWNSIEPDIINYTSTNDRARGGDYYSLGFAFNHKFNGNGHEIKTDFSYRKRNTDKLTLFKQLDESSEIIDGQKSTELEPSTSINFKIDYVRPFSEDSKFEAGYRADINSLKSVIDYFLYNTSSSKFEYADLYSTETKNDNNIHALYSMYSNKIEDLGFQVGLRAEYTDRLIKLIKTNESFIIDRFDFFPSAHISYNLGNGNQVMTSYTRRIDRPRGWQLEPFIVWIDPYNVRQGNPSLAPEYIDSYELSFQKLFKKSILSTELYYRINNNKSEYIQRAYEKNVTLRTIENVGKDFSFGTELMFNFDPIPNWNVNLMGNLYNYKVEGELNGRDFKKESFNWRTRFNNKLKITPTTQLQLNGVYNSPTVTAQGERKGYVMFNAGLKQEFLNKRLSVTLQVRDLFGTAKREYISESFDFYRHSEYTPESPIVMLNVRLNINNYKLKKKSNRDRRTNGDDDEF